MKIVRKTKKTSLLGNKQNSSDSAKDGFQQQIAALKTIQKVSTIIGSYAHFDEVYHTITYAICEFTPDTACCSLWLFDQETGRLHRKSIYIDNPDFSKTSLTPVEESLVKNIVANKVPELILDFKESEDTEPYLKKYSVFCTTLSVKNNIIGAICVWHKKSTEWLTFPKTTVEMFHTIAEQAGVAIENNELLTALVERQRIEKELEISRRIQQEFLPKTLPIVKYASIHACFLPANEVGGDYFDVIQLANGDLVFAINDVMGKGIPAAMFSAVTRITLHTILYTDSSPDKILTKMNSILYNDLQRAKSFVTMFCALYRHTERELLFSNAGHNHPLLFRSTTGQCEFLKAKGIFLGGLPDNDYPLEQLKLEIGDIVVFYTDGLKEAFNRTGKQIGIETIKETIIQNHLLDANQIISELLIEVFKYTRDYPLSDDLTIMVLKITL